MRVVLDTNVLLAGMATHGICEGLLLLCFRDHSVVVSEYILGEFAKHYLGKFKATPEQTASVVETIRHHSELVEPMAVPTTACDDPDDLPVLGTAIAGRVDCLVTGDKLLLIQKNYQGIPILSPRELYDRIRTNG